jgi:hypothetical protein
VSAEPGVATAAYGREGAGLEARPFVFKAARGAYRFLSAAHEPRRSDHSLPPRGKVILISAPRADAAAIEPPCA